jgi:hypothetical protein
MTNMMSDLINLIQSISYLKVGILKKKKRRYQIKCARPVSGITYIRYAQNRKIRKPNKQIIQY